MQHLTRYALTVNATSDKVCAYCECNIWQGMRILWMHHLTRHAHIVNATSYKACAYCECNIWQGMRMRILWMQHLTRHVHIVNASSDKVCTYCECNIWQGMHIYIVNAISYKACAYCECNIWQGMRNCACSARKIWMPYAQNALATYEQGMHILQNKIGLIILMLHVQSAPCVQFANIPAVT